LAASAAYLAQGGEISNMGSKVESHSDLSLLLPSVDDYSIRGSVIFVDGMGNLVTNISRELLNEASKGRSFEILVRKGFGNIEAVEEYYQSVDPGDWVAVYNESGFIELAIRDGSAKQLTGLQYGDMVRVEFK
jgi:S-adenosylmethionine hydrolase